MCKNVYHIEFPKILSISSITKKDSRGLKSSKTKRRFPLGTTREGGGISPPPSPLGGSPPPPPEKH